MGPTHGTKQRIMSRCQYNPASVNKAHRRCRVVATNGHTQTYKKAGDWVITDRHAREIEKEGYQS